MRGWYPDPSRPRVPAVSHPFWGSVATRRVSSVGCGGTMTSTSPRGTLQPTLRAHAPGYSAIAECLRRQAGATPQTGFARFRGLSPLAPEAWSWFQGALGEIEVGRQLSTLGPEWTVLHAVPIGDGATDIDHVVVGPAGIFVLNSKHHAGKKIWAGSWKMTVGGAPVDHIRNSKFEARRASDFLSRAARQRFPVTPVIVPVGALSISFGKKRPDVDVVSSDRLVGWLRRQPRVLSAEAVSYVSLIAEERGTWHSTAIDVSDTLRHQQRFDRLRGEIEAARLRARSWDAIRRLMVVGPILGLVAIVVDVVVR